MVNIKVPLYLTDFLKRRIRPKSRKNLQNYGRKKFRETAFTVFELTIFMVDFALQAAHSPQVTENLPMSCTVCGDWPELKAP